MGYSLQAQADSSWSPWIVLNKDKKQSQLFNRCQYVCAQAILLLYLYPCPAFPAVVEQNGCSHHGPENWLPWKGLLPQPNPMFGLLHKPQEQKGLSSEISQLSDSPL